MKASSLRLVGQAVTALSAVIIAYATLSPDVSAPTDADDRLLHFLLFLPLGAGGALWLAPLDQRRQRMGRALILLAIVALAAATELAQATMETRDGSFSDFVADVAGAGVGVIAGGLAASRARRSRKRPGQPREQSPE